MRYDVTNDTKRQRRLSSSPPLNTWMTGNRTMNDYPSTAGTSTANDFRIDKRRYPEDLPSAKRHCPNVDDGGDEYGVMSSIVSPSSLTIDAALSTVTIPCDGCGKQLPENHLNWCYCIGIRLCSDCHNANAQR